MSIVKTAYVYYYMSGMETMVKIFHMCVILYTYGIYMELSLREEGRNEVSKAGQKN